MNESKWLCPGSRCLLALLRPCAQKDREAWRPSSAAASCAVENTQVCLKVLRPEVYKLPTHKDEYINQDRAKGPACLFSLLSSLTEKDEGRASALTREAGSGVNWFNPSPVQCSSALCLV